MTEKLAKLGKRPFRFRNAACLASWAAKPGGGEGVCSVGGGWRGSGGGRRMGDGRGEGCVMVDH